MERPHLDQPLATRPRWWATTALALVLAVMVVGCGLDQDRYRWERALLVADRHVDHEEFDEAEASYLELQKTSPTPSFERYIAYRLALIVELRGQYADAIRAYEPMWKDGADDEYGSLALFRTAILLMDKLDRPDEGLKVLDRILSALPDSTAAKKALFELLGHYERNNDKAGALAFVVERYKLLASTPIGDNLLFARARLARELGRSDEALEAYAALLEDHPASGLRDDAEWELAGLLEELGRYDDALTRLRFITEDQDVSWYVGSYDSQYVDEARFQRGLIYLERLGQWREAVEEFTLFVDEFDESLLRDDARWNIVQAWLGAGESDDAEDACEALASAQPESRWVDDCERLVAALHGGADPRSLRTKAAD